MRYSAPGVEGLRLVIMSRRSLEAIARVVVPPTIAAAIKAGLVS